MLPLALATELLHTYLLIHDDIMDHAEVRRGQPAAHVRFRDAHRSRGLRGDAHDFGRSVGILLGDLAHTWAVELFAGRRRPRSPGRSSPAASRAMCEEVIGGQYLELLVAQRGPATGSGESAGDQTPRRKSCSPPAPQVRLLHGRAPDPARRPARRRVAAACWRASRRYGSAVGEAFQLQDDLLGMFGNADTVGKPVGDDLREGKFTFLIHHALSASARQPPESASRCGRPSAIRTSTTQTVSAGAGHPGDHRRTGRGRSA